jgi:hypothetical protein
VGISCLTRTTSFPSGGVLDDGEAPQAGGCCCGYGEAESVHEALGVASEWGLGVGSVSKSGFARCGDCGQLGWLMASKKLGRVVCKSCLALSCHPTLVEVVCGACGLEVRNLLAHLWNNRRCPQVGGALKMGNGAGRGPGQGLSYRDSRKVPWDVAWEPDDHVVEVVGDAGN